MHYYLMFFLITVCYSYTPITSFNKHFKINVIESQLINKKDTKCIVFFSGLSSFISYKYYSNLLHPKLNKIYIVNFGILTILQKL
jgi:hypothetical protein